MTATTQAQKMTRQNIDDVDPVDSEAPIGLDLMSNKAVWRSIRMPIMTIYWFRWRVRVLRKRKTHHHFWPKQQSSFSYAAVSGKCLYGRCFRIAQRALHRWGLFGLKSTAKEVDEQLILIYAVTVSGIGCQTRQEFVWKLQHRAVETLDGLVPHCKIRKNGQGFLRSGVNAVAPADGIGSLRNRDAVDRNPVLVALAENKRFVLTGGSGRFQ